MSFGDLTLKRDLQTALEEGQSIHILELWMGSPLLELPFDFDFNHSE